MNYKKFFELASLEKIEASEVTSSRSAATDITIFHNDVENFSVSDQKSITARGIYDGKLGAVSTERTDSHVMEFLVSGIKKNASVSESTDNARLFKGSKEYVKKNVYDKKLSTISIDEKIKKLKMLEESSRKASPLVAETQISYHEEESETELFNSYGLSLKSKSNVFYVLLSIVAVKDSETKSEFNIYFGNDFDAFDPCQFAKETVEKAVSKFGGVSIEAGMYPCVLSSDVVSMLMGQMVDAGFSAENIQKNSSVLKGKLGQKVFSDCVTIKEKPLDETIFFRYFDDEGVATKNKVLVDHGVVKCYLYNLDTAEKDNTEPTGNGYSEGDKIGTAAVHLVLEGGSRSESEIMEGIKKGVYVTGVTGLHSGLNANSGDFSLAGSGFLIEDGKIKSPLTVITVSGNLYTLFADVAEVASNNTLRMNGADVPSIRVNGLKISSL